MYKRILIKISGKAIKQKGNKGIDFGLLDNIARQVAYLVKSEIEVSVIFGGANFWDSEDRKEHLSMVASDYMGMIATAMNSIAFQEILEKYKISSKIQSSIHIEKIAEDYNIKSSIRELENDTVIIFAGGTGSTSFTTDVASIIKAVETESEIVLFAKINLDEEKPTELVDTSALNLAKKHQKPILIFDIEKENSIIGATLKNEGILIK